MNLDVLASGDEILTLRMFERMRSSLSQDDSATVISRLNATSRNERRTEHDDVNARLLELLRNGVATHTRPVVSVVDDDLAAGVEEVPDELLAAFHHLLAKRDRLRTLLSWDRHRFSEIQ